MVESEFGVDIRKKLFYTVADRGWAIIGLESLGMSLEDIFITVVNKTEDGVANESGKRKQSAPKRSRRTRNTLENDLADTLVKDAEQRRAEATDEIDDEDL